MGKLLLTSNGYFEGHTDDSYCKKLESYVKNKKVLFVDNATITGSNVKNIPMLLDNFRKIAQLVTETTLNQDNLSTIYGYDTIYITGGDCTPLIDLANNTHAKKHFIEYLCKGGNIIGESAGSLIFEPNIKYYYDIKRGTKPKYDIDLPTFDGFDLVNIYIYPHFNKANDEMKAKTIQYERQHNIKITRLNDGEYMEYEF